MKKLWQKNTNSNKLVDEYCFGEGVTLDNNLIEEDVYGSIAHAHALVKLKIITQGELLKLKKVLTEILSLKNKGIFVVEQGDEDIHTKIENYLVEKLGDLGKKIHTGRSRNDQVLVDLRLYSKKQLLSTVVSMNQLIDTFIGFAQKHEFIPMPGYTHMQKAMPSSIGMWAGSFAESLLDDLKMLTTAYELNDQCPLGTGAAYGISFPIDRALISELLGFSKVQNNSLYTQVSRSKIQLAIMQSLIQVMLTLSRFAQDMLLFTTSEFNFFSTSPELCTGSSIMPQKKNLDIMEFVRAKTHVTVGYGQIIASISAGLPSGYNADMGETKGYFMKSFEIALKSIEVVKLLVHSMKPNKNVLQKAMTSELYATHAAYGLVKKGMPFRKAYQTIGKSLNSIPKYDPMRVMKESKHIGGTGNLNIQKLQKQISALNKVWKQKHRQYQKIISLLTHY